MKALRFISFSLCLALNAGSMAQSLELSRGDAQFLQGVSQSGMYEIQAGTMAEQNASLPQLKEFAKMMVADHTKIDAQLKSLAARKGCDLPTELSGPKKSDIGGLQQKKGPDFDRSYVDLVALRAHQEAVHSFEQARQNAKDDDVKAFAIKILPILQQHLRQGTELKATLDSQENIKKAPPPAGSPESHAQPPSAPVPESGVPAADRPVNSTNKPGPASADKAAESQ